MKPTAIFILSGLLSLVVAVGASYLLHENANKPESLASENDSSVILARAVERLDDLDRRQTEFENRITQSLAAPDTTGIRTLRTNFDLEMGSLRDELAQLKKEVAETPARPSRESIAGLPAIDDEETAVALAKFVDEKVQEKVRESQRKQFTPMIRAGMSQRMKRTISKLGLNDDQARRFEESSNAALENIMPSIEVMMDRSASPEEKQKAFTEMDGAVEDVARDAQSYMTPEQHEQLLAEQERQQVEMERMRAMWGGGGGQTSGTPTGSSRTTGN